MIGPVLRLVNRVLTVEVVNSETPLCFLVEIIAVRNPRAFCVAQVSAPIVHSRTPDMPTRSSRHWLSGRKVQVLEFTPDFAHDW